MEDFREDIVERLTGPEGSALLARVAEAGAAAATPAVQTGLRADHGPELTRLALRIGEARRRSAEKFPDADRLFFTPELLEQASAHPVAVHRARRFRGAERLLDLGCGAGGDLTRAALAGLPVAGLEADPLAAALARANLAATGSAGEVVHGRFPDVPPPAHDALFADPARREAGRGPRGSRRLFRPEDFDPRPDDLGPRLAEARSWAVKWGPGLPLDHAALSAPGALLAGFGPDDYEVEVVSWNGSVREAVIRGGEIDRVRRRATVLTGPVDAAVAVEFVGDPDAGPPSLREPDAWLHEPDGALLRAGLMNDFAARESLGLLADGIAYLTSDRPSASPLVRSWRRLDGFRWSRRRLRDALRALGAGRVAIKTRGFPQTPEEVRSGLDLHGDREVVVFLHRDGDGHSVHLAEPPTREVAAP